MVYKGNFKQSAQLPAYIPYEMVQPATDVPSNPTLSPTQIVSSDLFGSIFKEFIETIQQVWQTEWPTIIILIVSLFTLVAVKAIDKR